MADVHSPYLRGLLIVAALLIAGFAFNAWSDAREPFRRSMAAGHRAFADAEYERALRSFGEALAVRPADSRAFFGQALALMQLDRGDAALAAYDQALVTASSRRERAFIFANRGILHDRDHRYHEALADYLQALDLDASVAEGPGLVTRFIHNQVEQPPTIANRARYLREQLAKPEGERLLSLPAQDGKAYPHRQ